MQHISLARNPMKSSQVLPTRESICTELNSMTLDQITKENLIYFLKQYCQIPEKHSLLFWCFIYYKANKDISVNKLLNIVEKDLTQDFTYYQLGAFIDVSNDSLLRKIINKFTDNDRIPELKGLKLAIEEAFDKENGSYRLDDPTKFHEDMYNINQSGFNIKKAPKDDQEDAPKEETVSQQLQEKTPEEYKQVKRL